MKLFQSAAVVVTIALVPAAAGAQGTAEQESACMGDAFQFCGEFIPNATKIEACLRKNIRTISPACRAQFNPRGQRGVTPVADRHRPY